MEFEDIREALDALFGVNDRRTTSRVKDTETSLWRDQTIDDLKELITLNDPNTMFGKVSTIIDSGVKTGERKFELKDLQESNYELLANICDLLGMSEIYLND